MGFYISANAQSALDHRRLKHSELAKVFQVNACHLEGFECRNFSVHQDVFEGLKSNFQPAKE